jgi:hypothetical protein
VAPLGGAPAPLLRAPSRRSRRCRRGRASAPGCASRNRERCPRGMCTYPPGPASTPRPPSRWT